MKLGVLTVLYADRSLEEVLDWAVELGLDAVELGTGNYPGNAHWPPAELLGDPGRIRALRDAVTSRGLVISALSCHGNPLHPQEEVSREHYETWRRTLELAEALEVPVIRRQHVLRLPRRRSGRPPPELGYVRVATGLRGAAHVAVGGARYPLLARRGGGGRPGDRRHPVRPLGGGSARAS